MAAAVQPGTSPPVHPGRRHNRARRWLDDRRILTKILMVVGLATLGTVVTNVLALVGMTGLNATRDHEVGKQAPYISALGSAELAAKSAANDERGYLLSSDTKYRDEALNRQTAVNQQLKIARSLATGTAQVATVDAIQQSVDAWFTALRAEFIQFERDPLGATALSFNANRDLRKTYEAQLAKELEHANTALVEGRDFDSSAAGIRLGLLLTLGVVLLVTVACAVWVGKMIVAPLRLVDAVLHRVADGDLGTDVDVEQGDEAGQMAEALRRAIGSLRATVSSLAGHAAALDDSSRSLASTSEHSARSAADGAERADSVAGAATEMAETVQSVATSAEEMGSSIRQIAESAANAVAVAEQAVATTASAAEVIGRLGASSSEIGNVVDLITSIAAQTNLLALNATIEAARAGESGKGFAVVANEVKELAQETAAATRGIGQRVTAIQADTAAAIGAVEQITSIMNQISEYQTIIASAAEEQTATTHAMSRDIAEAASAGTLVAETIGDVAALVRASTAGIEEASRAAAGLTEVATDLRGTVAGFRY